LESGRPRISTLAPATLVLSQHFGGLLLRLVCLSCFIQAPPMGFKEQGRSHRTIIRLVKRTPSVRTTFVADASMTHPQDETRDAAFNRSIQRQGCHDCCVDSLPFETSSGLTSQAPSHSPIVPRTKQRGGGLHEDQPTFAPDDRALMPPSSMRPRRMLCLPEGLLSGLNQNQATRLDRDRALMPPSSMRPRRMLCPPEGLLSGLNQNQATRLER